MHMQPLNACSNRVTIPLPGILASTMTMTLAAAAWGQSCPPEEWQLIDPPSPSARSFHAMAFDSLRDRTVLFGSGADVWEFDGETWTAISSPGPASRMKHAMTFDSARGRNVVFGGRDSGSYAQLSDTWEWDGSSWEQRQAAGPSARDFHAMAYDSARGRTVLFGGWDGRLRGALRRRASGLDARAVFSWAGPAFSGVSGSHGGTSVASRCDTKRPDASRSSVHSGVPSPAGRIGFRSHSSVAATRGIRSTTPTAGLWD
jgi:hypothetical protein